MQAEMAQFIQEGGGNVKAIRNQLVGGLAIAGGFGDARSGVGAGVFGDYRPGQADQDAKTDADAGAAAGLLQN